MDHWVGVTHCARLGKPYSWKIYHARAMVRIDGERAARQMLEEIRPSVAIGQRVNPNTQT